MTLRWQEMINLVKSCTYKPGWRAVFKVDRGSTPGRPYIQIEVSTEAEASFNVQTGERQEWRGGKHYLSLHMCRQEVVGAVYGAIRAAEEHEMREWFRYKGASIYNPHLDPEVLAEVARKKDSFNVREGAMGMAG